MVKLLITVEVLNVLVTVEVNTSLAPIAMTRVTSDTIVTMTTMGGAIDIAYCTVVLCYQSLVIYLLVHIHLCVAISPLVGLSKSICSL